MTIRIVCSLHKWRHILDHAASSASRVTLGAWDVAPNGGVAIEPDDERMASLKPLVMSGTIASHMVTIALRQIQEQLVYLEKTPVWQGEVEKLAKVFLDAVNQQELRDLRNVLEHEAEYMAGDGVKPSLVVHRGYDWPEVTCADGDLISVSVFGRTYYVHTAIIAARDFVASLPNYGSKLRVVFSPVDLGPDGKDVSNHG
jgi:hypothetical protein